MAPENQVAFISCTALDDERSPSQKTPPTDAQIDDHIRESDMKTVGIIAEYNPFHKGHTYQIQKARELSGADYVIAVMSPDFVQRGSVALVDKWTRTRMALLGGADLVLELPVCYACASAEYFAEGGVALLNALNTVDGLSFGCEAGNLELLSGAAHFFALPREEEPSLYRNDLQKRLKMGHSYPLPALQRSFLSQTTFWRLNISKPSSGCTAHSSRFRSSGLEKAIMAKLLCLILMRMILLRQASPVRKAAAQSPQLPQSAV